MLGSRRLEVTPEVTWLLVDECTDIETGDADS